MKDWSGNSRAPFAALGSSEHSARARAQNDYYATDPKAIDALNKLLPLNGLYIWECACGEGHLSKRMEQLGAKVVSTDLYDRNYGTPGVNFLKQTRLLAPVIVTNPPYKYAQEFVEKSLRLGADKVCMFLKLTFLEGQKRRGMFDTAPPKTVAVFSKRIQVAINGDPEEFKKGSAVCYAWYIWEQGYKDKPRIEWI